MDSTESLKMYIQINGYGCGSIHFATSPPKVDVEDMGTVEACKIVPDPFHDPSEFGVEECKIVLYPTITRSAAVTSFENCAYAKPIFRFKFGIRLNTYMNKYDDHKTITTYNQYKDFVQLVVKHCRTMDVPIVKVRCEFMAERAWFYIQGTDITVADSVLVFKYTVWHVSRIMNLYIGEDDHDCVQTTMSARFSTLSMRTADNCMLTKLENLLTKLESTHYDTMELYKNDVGVKRTGEYDLYFLNAYEREFSVRRIVNSYIKQKWIHIAPDCDCIGFIDDNRPTWKTDAYAICDNLLKICASTDEL